MLEEVSQEASEALGRTIGTSAIVRALIQYAARQPTLWVAATLFPFIQEEIESGLVWGRKKKARRSRGDNITSTLEPLPFATEEREF